MVCTCGKIGSRKDQYDEDTQCINPDSNDFHIKERRLVIDIPYGLVLWSGLSSLRGLVYGLIYGLVIRILLLDTLRRHNSHRRNFRRRNNHPHLRHLRA